MMDLISMTLSLCINVVQGLLTKVAAVQIKIHVCFIVILNVCEGGPLCGPLSQSLTIYIILNRSGEYILAFVSERCVYEVQHPALIEGD